MFRFLALLLLSLTLAACRGGGQTQPGPSVVTPSSSANVAEEPGATSAAGPTVAGAIVRIGVSTGTLRYGGIERSYRVFVPRAVSAGEALPLVVGLHGGLGSGAQFASTTQFEALAESEGFFAVFPDGVGRTWNGGRCCGQAARQDVDDVGFLAALIEQLALELPLDPERVFMTGHSNGAIMAWRFGCERADLVAAIAPVAGSLEVRSCAPVRGVSLLAIHGDADQNHPLEGGRGTRSIAGVDFTSAAESMRLWTEGAGCDSAPVRTPAQGVTTTDAWESCDEGARAILTVIHGADHPWPGGTVLAPEIQGEPSQALNATEVVWGFFESLGAR
ncbi:MAG: alpha/beta fold hydrolase [Dehalococcoidia bacterium]